MDCKECAENLTAFLDGELKTTDSVQVKTHVNLCASCADELRSLKEAADFIETHRNDLEPQAESWNLIRARISAMEPPSRQRLFSPSRWQLAVAALAVFAALSTGYLQYQQIRKRDLDTYISQYIQDREARGLARSAQWNAEFNSQIDVPYADNPFTEVNVTPADNPFSSEDR